MLIDYNALALVQQRARAFLRQKQLFCIFVFPISTLTVEDHFTAVLEARFTSD
jgi:hypothetical protein